MRVMTSLMKDDTQLFKQFVDNESFKRLDERCLVRARLPAAVGEELINSRAK